MQAWRAQRWAFLAQLGNMLETEAKRASLTPAEREALPAAEALALADWLRALQALNQITGALGQVLLAEVRAQQRAARAARRASLKAGAVPAATAARLCPKHRAKAAPK